nr:MAG TPA: hypothetical protein [Caudoviricetes sp.]
MSQKRLVYWLFALFIIFSIFKIIHFFLCLLISYTTDKLQILHNKNRPKCNRTAFFTPII